MITKIKSLKNHQGFMKYFKNTSWLFGEKILRMVVGLFVGIWIARYLGPEKCSVKKRTKLATHREMIRTPKTVSIRSPMTEMIRPLFITIATLGFDGIIVKYEIYKYWEIIVK